VAFADGEPIACGAVTVIAPGIASLKRMWVAFEKSLARRRRSASLRA
jgi:hypothetical protein